MNILHCSGFINKKDIIIWTSLLFFIQFSGCNSLSLKRGLLTEPMKDEDVQGNADLILYGGNYAGDMETIAMLDIAGDEYEFEPFAPEFKYRIKTGLSGREALAEAEKFVSGNPSFYSIRFSKILDEKGAVIGYEVRPLYYPFVFGVSDVLDADYRIKGNKVVVKIQIMKSIQNMLSDGDGGGGEIDAH